MGQRPQLDVGFLLPIEIRTLLYLELGAGNYNACGVDRAIQFDGCPRAGSSTSTQAAVSNHAGCP